MGDLFRREGRYTYHKGWNPVALIALAVGVAPNVPGFLAAAGAISGVPSFFLHVYTYAWFVGFFLSGLLYFLLSRKHR